MEPIYVVELDKDAIMHALEKVIDAGHPDLPESNRGEWESREDPVLKATGVKSENS